MKKYLAALVLVLAMGRFAFCDTAEVSSKISAIDIKGNRLVQENEIRGALFSRVGENLEELKVKNDQKAIYALGYFEDVSYKFDNYNQGTRITYEVRENPVIKKVGVEGNIVYSTAEVLSVIKIREGQVLNYRVLRGDIESINQYYKKGGYALSRISDVVVSPDKTDVTFKIVEGMIEGITLEGNDVTKDYVILREMKTKPGKVFNETVFSKDLHRIFNLGFFSELNPAFEAGSTPDKAMIHLKIKETKTNNINFGGGYGEQEGWFGFTDLSINNLMGTARGLMLKGQFGQTLTTYQFKYYDPWFYPEKFGDRTSMTYRLWNTMGTDIYLTQQDEFHVGQDVTIGKYLRDDYQSSFSIGSESVSPRGGASFDAYTSDYIGASLSYDTRDFWMNPTKGVYHTISFKQGLTNYATRETNFTKLGLDINTFTPFGLEHGVVAWHVGVGVGLGDVPLGELYWAGGPTTVRGYGINDVHKGSRKLIVNLEYRYTFNDVFQGVLFYDWGDAWDLGGINTADFLTGWGPGSV